MIARRLLGLSFAVVLGAAVVAGGLSPASAQGFSAKAHGMFFGFGDDEGDDATPRRLCLPTDSSIRRAIADGSLPELRAWILERFGPRGQGGKPDT